MNKEEKKNTATISKESIHRLLRDVKNIIKNPLTDNDIYYCHDDEDILKGYAMIVGPSETPYFAGYYFFEFNYPTDYPHSPPVLKYWTNDENIRFNPNLYTSGKVCVSLLNTWSGEQWTSCQTISTVLLTLCTLLCKDPLLNEPGAAKTHMDFHKYTRIIEYKNIDIAVLKMITKNPSCFPDPFDIFYPVMREKFLKNVEPLKKYLEDKLSEKPERLMTSYYSLNVFIDYPALYKKFESVVELIQPLS